MSQPDNTTGPVTSKPDVSHVDDIASDVSSTKENLAKEEILLRDAQDGAAAEHELTFSGAVKYHKKAIFWAIILSGTIVMEGYDNILISSFFGYPSFQKKYGVPVGEDENGEMQYELEGNWQSGLGGASSAGLVLGVFLNGYLTEKFGHRHVILVSLVVMSAFIFATFFAPNVQTLLAGQLLCGIPWGVFATMGPTYSSEVCPMALRGYLTAYVNMCWAMGQFVAAGVLQGLVDNDTQWGYRIPFAIQWVWPVPLFIMTYLAPDSPWWLVRKERHEDAVKAVKRLSSSAVHFKAHQQVALMIHTNKLEKEEQKLHSHGFKGFFECFKGTNLRRTEISCITMAGQTLSGTAFAYSPSYFFTQTGLAASDAYKLNLGTTGIAFTGTFMSWFLINKFGRRHIYVAGYTMLVTVLLIIGILDGPGESNPTIVWAQAGLCLVWVATYALTIGPLAFTIVAEMSATRLRSQTVALARNCYNIVQLISHIVEPYLINPTEANLKGRTAFVWFGTAFPTLVWAFFRLPETKDRTYEELDILFEKRLPARKFRKYVFSNQELDELDE